MFVSFDMDSPLLLSPHVQAIINCTVTPSMTFTKTSQKFGQWADSRANTVYGLGFATEQQLHQVGPPGGGGGGGVYLFCVLTEAFSFFICPHPMKQFSEKFKEVKDAARLAREKSQDKELANSALTIAAPQVSPLCVSVEGELSTAGMSESELN